MAMAKLFSRRAQRRAFLVHVDEDLAEPPVVVFAGAQINLVAADHRFLGVALAPCRQPLALAQHRDALDDLLHHLFGQAGGARRRGPLDEGFHRVLFVVLVGDQLRS